jgi:membrane associated rhomboid family serine protease|tara:strand:- start:9061 stop:9999 length:939 start_codon:yes stop_codon:yes gene_type:complete
MSFLNQLNSGKFRFYWSILIGIITVGLFIIIQNASNWQDITPETYAKYGAPYAKDIFDGAIWGMITNSFVHKQLWHLFLSVPLFIFLGILFERRNTALFFILFVAISSFVTSSLQLSMTGDPGIGLNGVNFALFTYLLVKIKPEAKYGKFKITIWVGTLLALTLSILNIFNDWYNFGTTTILTGFLFGLIVAISQKRKFIFYSFQGIFWAICLITLFYNPYSSEWNTVQGSKAFSKGEVDKAEEYYLKALEIHPRNYAAKKNLVLIEIDRLQDRAYYAHSNGDYSTARMLYIKILNLDKYNSWAKKNLDGLP